MGPTDRINQKPNLIVLHPTRRVHPKAIKLEMEEGVYPYGWNGFIMGSLVFDQGTQIENFQWAMVVRIIQKIKREERKAAMSELAYFIQDTVRADDGGYIPCIAERDVAGYTPTNWNWGPDREIAEQLVKERNERLGITELEATEIVVSTYK